MPATPRDMGETLAYLGHVGQVGRRPRGLVGIIVGVGPANSDGGPTTADVALYQGGDPIRNLVVHAGFGGGRLPVSGERVSLEAIQYDLVVRDAYPT